MSKEFALYIPSCGAIDYAKAEEILTDSMLRMVLVPWGVFFTDLSKNIEEYNDPHDLEVEYQDFLSELHEWLPESCNSFGKKDECHALTQMIDSAHIEQAFFQIENMNHTIILYIFRKKDGISLFALKIIQRERMNMIFNLN